MCHNSIYNGRNWSSVFLVVDREKEMNSIDMAHQVLNALRDQGIEGYIYHKAVTTESVYVKFEDQRLCSLRIGDHDGKERYRYKWNLRSDYTKFKVKIDNGIKRFFFPWEEWSRLVDRIVEYKRNAGRSFSVN